MDCFEARPFSPLAQAHGALRRLTEAERQETIFFSKRAVGRAALVRGKGTQWVVLAVWRKMRSRSSLWTFLAWTGAINHMALCFLRGMLCSLPSEADGAISAHQQRSSPGPGAPADGAGVTAVAGDISSYAFGMFLPLNEIIPLVDRKFQHTRWEKKNVQCRKGKGKLCYIFA